MHPDVQLRQQSFLWTGRVTSCPSSPCSGPAPTGTWGCQERTFAPKTVAGCRDLWRTWYHGMQAQTVVTHMRYWNAIHVSVSLTTVCNGKRFPLLAGICIAAWSHHSFLNLKVSSSNSHIEELLVTFISNSLFIKLPLHRTLHFHVSVTSTAFFSFYSLGMKGAHPYSPAVWGLKQFIYSLQAHE